MAASIPVIQHRILYSYPTQNDQNLVEPQSPFGTLIRGILPEERVLVIVSFCRIQFDKIAAFSKSTNFEQREGQVEEIRSKLEIEIIILYKIPLLRPN